MTAVCGRAACSKPDQGGLQQLVGPVGEQMSAAGALAEGRGPAFHHCKAVAEALGGLSWVLYSGPACGETTPVSDVTLGRQDLLRYFFHLFCSAMQSGAWWFLEFAACGKLSLLV